jgi:hypothetical protein
MISCPCTPTLPVLTNPGPCTPTLPLCLVASSPCAWKPPHTPASSQGCHLSWSCPARQQPSIGMLTGSSILMIVVPIPLHPHLPPLLVLLQQGLLSLGAVEDPQVAPPVGPHTCICQCEGMGLGGALLRGVTMCTMQHYMHGQSDDDVSLFCMPLQLT